MNIDALFFGAHPDDVELSCGGTLFNITSSGRKAAIIDLTEGELGTRGSVELRSKEAAAGAKILGAEFRTNLQIPDGGITNTPDNRLKIIRLIREYKPKIIFAPYAGDRHPDHIHASELITEAAFYSGLAQIKSELNKKPQDAYRPGKVFYYMQTYTFEPSFITDISGSFETKMKAVNCYSSQFYNPESKEPDTFISDKKFIEYIEARAKFYGFYIGVKYGEPFFTKEKIKFLTNQLFE
jgi:bacillithiol biosynthesis deacetylase BshB1